MTTKDWDESEYLELERRFRSQVEEPAPVDRVFKAALKRNLLGEHRQLYPEKGTHVKRQPHLWRLPFGITSAAAAAALIATGLYAFPSLSPDPLRGTEQGAGQGNFVEKQDPSLVEDHPSQHADDPVAAIQPGSSEDQATESIPEPEKSDVSFQEAAGSQDDEHQQPPKTPPAQTEHAGTSGPTSTPAAPSQASPPVQVAHSGNWIVDEPVDEVRVIKPYTITMTNVTPYIPERQGMTASNEDEGEAGMTAEPESELEKDHRLFGENGLLEENLPAAMHSYAIVKPMKPNRDQVLAVADSFGMNGPGEMHEQGLQFRSDAGERLLYQQGRVPVFIYQKQLKQSDDQQTSQETHERLKQPKEKLPAGGLQQESSSEVMASSEQVVQLADQFLKQHFEWSLEDLSVSIRGQDSDSRLEVSFTPQLAGLPNLAGQMTVMVQEGEVIEAIVPLLGTIKEIDEADALLSVEEVQQMLSAVQEKDSAAITVSGVKVAYYHFPDSMVMEPVYQLRGTDPGTGKKVEYIIPAVRDSSG